MIFDQISNWELYKFGPAWEKAFEFLNSLAPGAEETKYPIQGEDIFARLMSYETIPPDDAAFEAHMKYVDIQTLLAGSEAMEWAPAHVPELKGPYNEEKDVIFFKRLPETPARIVVNPELFAVFFPDDAHMPQLNASGKPETVKKVVVKIRCDLLK